MPDADREACQCQLLFLGRHDRSTLMGQHLIAETTLHLICDQSVVTGSAPEAVPRPPTARIPPKLWLSPDITTSAAL
jgi:hypothetical protein